MSYLLTHSFVLDEKVDAGGTYLLETIEATYSELYTIFNEPFEGDDYKISGEWVFREEGTEEVITLYDWKSTDLYDRDYPSVDEFRNSKGRSTFSIGGRNPETAAKFKAYLEKELEILRRPNSIKYIIDK